MVVVGQRVKELDVVGERFVSGIKIEVTPWEKKGTTSWGDYMVKRENDIMKELHDEETKWWKDYTMRWLNDKETR